jgi:hypothetical protein
MAVATRAANVTKRHAHRGFRVARELSHPVINQWCLAAPHGGERVPLLSRI